ncbi:hypothetical protein BH23GEM2_BH23GEM2_04680 [soil metagenome]
MHIPAAFVVPLLTSFLAAPPDSGGRDAPALAVIAAHTNRVPAGRMVDGTWSVELTVGPGRWFPEADDGPNLEVLAFAEAGGPLSIPGPLLRVPAGTRMRVTVSNPLSVDLSVFGLQERPGGGPPVRIAAGGKHVFEFTATTAGTYAYGAFTGQNEGRDFTQSCQLSGAFIVDDPAVQRDDRVFLLGLWFQDRDSSATGVVPERETMVINGKSWPYTERLELIQGDSVHWRIVNATAAPHPMHLHGFYFRVDSRGSVRADTIYTPDQQRLAVTELMYAGSTFTMSFVPTQPGNWVFHCHFAFHVGPHMILKAAGPTGDEHSSHEGARHMAGLVLGFHVAATGPQPPPPELRREINMFVHSAPGRYGNKPGLAFVIQQGVDAPAADSVPAPSHTLFLTRDEPVRINVLNRTGAATAIHWHGIELESFPDGVPDWSGMPGNLFTRVPAGGTFAAEYTPPRAGTFIYHSHLDEMDQIMSGLFAPLIVLEPGQNFDPEHDKIFIAGGAGPPPDDFTQPQAGTVNGSRDPDREDLIVGRTYRFRLININPDWRVAFSLGSDTALVSWRPVAKDGADLPEPQRTLRAAYLLTGPGETADFEFTPIEPGFLRLAIRTYEPGWHTRVNIRIRPAPPR